MTPIEKAQKLRKIIEIAVQSLDDETALEAVSLFPIWSGDGVEYTGGQRVQFSGTLFYVLKAHTSAADKSPDAAADLFEAVTTD